MSRLPEPGTIPPVAKPFGVFSPPLTPRKKPPKPVASLMPARVANSGRTGFNASANLISADAKFNAVLANNWKDVLSLILLTKAKNSSFTLVILMAREACAVAASSAKEPLPLWATFNASCAVANCCSNGITLPI